MGALKIRRDRTSAVLRKLVKGESNGRVARRILAIANALDGMSREAAAQSAGMDRQTLRDWVIRYNEQGIEGLQDRWGDGRPPIFTREEQAELMRIVLAGPDPGRAGCPPTRSRIWPASARSGSASGCIPGRSDGC
jgi:transposase-like protein